MTAYSSPSTILSLSEDGASVTITKDERQPFGSIEIRLNEAGLERFPNLIDEYRCDGLALSCDGMAENRIRHHFSPDLNRISHPENITALRIGTTGRFARDFDFNAFERFENVRSLSVESIPVIEELTDFFPRLEILKIFDWAKNRVRYRETLWPRLRGLHVVSFKGDLSALEGWNIQVLFLHHSKPVPFSSLRSFPELQTFAAERLDADIDLSLLSSLSHLKHLSLRMPRHPAKTAGFTSRTLEMMILDKADPAGLVLFDVERDFPKLKFYGIDFGRKREFMRWDGFRPYGDPFASVSFIRPYPPE